MVYLHPRIDNLKKNLHIQEIFINSNIIITADEGTNDFYKAYNTNVPNNTSTVQKIELKGLLNKIFTPVEYQFSQKITPYFRKIEWLVGRLLAKLAIYDCLKQTNSNIAQLNQLEVSLDKSKKPEFKILVDASHEFKDEIFFSISHKQGHIVSISSLQHPIGIDIERIQDLSLTLTNKFVHGTELSEYLAFSHTKGLDTSEKYLNTGLWCIKEATSKAIGLGLAVDFRKIHVKFEDGKLFIRLNSNNSIYLADIMTRGDYLIGLVRRIN